MYLKTSRTYVNNVPEPCLSLSLSLSLSLAFIKEEDCKVAKLYRNVSLIKIRKRLVKSSKAPRYATLKN
jgi:hypothetical protein